MNVAEIQMYRGTSEIDLSKQATVLVQPQFNPVSDFGPAKLIDHNSLTFAHTDADPQGFIEVQLKVPEPVSRVVVSNRIDFALDRIVGCDVEFTVDDKVQTVRINTAQNQYTFVMKDGVFSLSR